MKMNKLFSSIAASAMVLTALAPAAVANAASGHPTNVQGTGVGPYTNNGNLGMATSASANVTDGSATAQSDANVKVIDGFLVLQAVPDFGFGTAMAGSKDVRLIDGTSMRPDDGKPAGTVAILDSRNAATAANGFELKATVDEFTDSANQATPGFVLNFDQFTEDKNADNTHLNTNPSIQIPADGKTSGQIINQKNTRGQHYFTYKGLGNQVTLAVPDKIPADQYSSTINWTLSAKAV